MKKKLVGIFVCMLLIITILPVAGINNDDRIQWFIGGNCISADWIEQDKLIASDGAIEDRFGWSVWIDDDCAFVGAPLDDDNGIDSGSVYVFTRNGNSWIQQQKLLPSDGSAGDRFGTVFHKGDTAFVGAFYDDDNGIDSGSVYVFTYDGSMWTEQQKLIPSDGAANDNFGYSIAFDGDTALIGAPGPLDTGASPGYVYVFKYEGSSWIEEVKLLASDGAANDQFGYDSSIRGDYIVVGARGDDDLTTSAGSAYIFYYDGDEWIEQAKLMAPDGAMHDWFGDSVEIYRDIVCIGAPRDDDKGFNSGSVYVYNREGTTWTFQAKLTPSDGRADDWFGASIIMDQNRAVIGAPGNFASTTAGYAYIFKYDGISWIEEARLAASDAAYDDDFGIVATISREYVIVGARKDDDHGSDSGSAYVFKNIEPEPFLEIGEINGGLGVSFEIANIGNANANDIEWTITFDGGFVIPKQKTGTISILESENYETASVIVFGLGTSMITVSVECAEGCMDEKSVSGFVLLFFVLGVS